MKFNFTKISLYLFSISIVLMPCGTHLQSTSSNYQEYIQYQINDVTSEYPGEDLGPGIGLGFALANAWPFVLFIYIICLAGFWFCIYLIRSLKAKFKTMLAARIGFSFFSVCCLWPIGICFSGAVTDFHWGFIILAMAKIITSIALCTGIIGLYRELSNKPACFTGRVYSRAPVNSSGHVVKNENFI